MNTQGRRLALGGYLLLGMAAIFLAGCGSGGGSGANPTPAPTATVNNTRVVADAGPMIAVDVNTTTTTYPFPDAPDRRRGLNGSLSTTSSTDPLTFAWTFLLKPEGSTVGIDAADTALPEFIPDQPGAYILQLIVSAGGVTSARRLTSVVAIATDGSNAIEITRGHSGLSGNCNLCHDGSERNSTVRPRSPDHVASSSLCVACHSALGFDKIVVVDHQEVVGICSECHDGVTATGKSQWHQLTSGECSDCHDTSGWFQLDDNDIFDHSTVARACSTCHNGNAVIGKHPGHIPTTSECNFCHNTIDFKDAFVDHSPVGFARTQDCASCHVRGNGTGGAIGYPDYHPDMNIVTGVTVADGGVNCSTCHGVETFAMAEGVFNHGKVTPDQQSCSTCHIDGPSGATFPGAFSTGDFPANVNGGVHRDIGILDCHACHNTETFVGGMPEHTTTNPQYGDMTINCARSTCHDDNGVTVFNPGVVGLPAPGLHVPLIADLTMDNGLEDCVVCHTPPGGTFSSGFYVHEDHSVDPVTTPCADCHDNVISVGIDEVLHPPIFNVANCGGCHDGGFITFEGAIYDHAIIPGGTGPGTAHPCAECHNGVMSISYSDNHMPATSQDCGVCHITPASVASATFAGYGTSTVMDHTGIDGNPDRCQTCHNGRQTLHLAAAADKPILGKSANHVPVGNNCSDCHSDTTVPRGFTATSTVTNFKNNLHNNYDNGCEGCHQKKFFPDSGGTESAFVKKETTVGSVHVPTTQDCHYCHAATDAVFKDISKFAHRGINGNCKSCHDGSTSNVAAGADGPPPNDPQTQTYLHNPISDPSKPDCIACHSTKGTTFDNGAINHADPTVAAQRCDSCHSPGGSATISKDSAPAPGHIQTSEDCDVCHTAGGDFANAIFDHSTLQPNQRCDSCHGGANPTSSYVMPADHIDISIPRTTPTQYKDCGVCHDTTGFAGAKYDHTGIDTGCIDCHNGSTATGQSGNHLPTNKDCYICHTTANAGFKPPTLFDHSQITLVGTTCESCHDDVIATGKTNFGTYRHIYTTDDCGSCHSIDGAWADGGADHAAEFAKGTPCNTCHKPGGSGLDKSAKTNPPHWYTTLDCGSCHSTPGGGSFNDGAPWVHNANYSRNNCTECHSPASQTGGGATDKSSGHFATSDQCDVCHTTNSWTPVRASANAPYDHCPGTTANRNSCDPDTGNRYPGYPGDHASSRAAACGACHTSNTETPAKWDTGYLTYKCTGCHLSDYRSGHGGTPPANRQDCTKSGCHRATVASTRWDEP